MTPKGTGGWTRERRFWTKVDRRASNECWEWTGHRNAQGYGRFQVDGQAIGAHRVVWEMTRGPIPFGLTIDHQCNNPGCVNPRHLRLATQRENILRGSGPPAINARKTHCLAGHEYTEANTYRYPDGRRECAICRRVYYAKRYQVRKAAGLLAVLTALLMLLPAVAQAKFKPPLVIQEEQGITCDSWGWRDNALEASRELGAKVVRVNMIEWRPGCAGADAAVDMIAQAGMKPQITLAGSPAYMAATVRRHRATVSTYTVWNEPELNGYRCCTAPFREGTAVGTAKDYRVLFPKMSRLIKRLDPGAKVCWGEHSPHGMGGYLKRALKKQRRRVIRADCLAVHPYHWFWSESVDRGYLKALAGFSRLVGRLARERRLCRGSLLTSSRIHHPQRRSCRPVPIYNTEAGQPLWDGQAGDAQAVSRAYRYCVKLKFKQCAQYQIFPAFDHTHSAQTWQTPLTDLNCQPTATFYALRRAVTGRRGLARITWPECPKPIPNVTVPLPPKWGTPLLPPLPPVAPPEPEPVPEVLPDQPPILVIPEPVPPLEELPITLPGPPEPVVEPTPIEATPPNPLPEPGPVPPAPEPELAVPIDVTPERPIEVPPTEGETP